LFPPGPVGSDLPDLGVCGFPLSPAQQGRPHASWVEVPLGSRSLASLLRTIQTERCVFARTACEGKKRRGLLNFLNSFRGIVGEDREQCGERGDRSSTLLFLMLLLLPSNQMHDQNQRPEIKHAFHRTTDDQGVWKNVCACKLILPNAHATTHTLSWTAAGALVCQALIVITRFGHNGHRTFLSVHITTQAWTYSLIHGNNTLYLRPHPRDRFATTHTHTQQVPVSPPLFAAVPSVCAWWLKKTVHYWLVNGCKSGLH
jgi:hypothetical protein